MKIANKPLDHPNTSERDSSSNDLQNKSEEDLKHLIIQLRAQLQHIGHRNECAKQPNGLAPASAEKGTMPDPEPALSANVEAALCRGALKEMATQTVLVQGNAVKLKHEGKIPTSEDKVWCSRLSQEWERHQQRPCAKSELHRETPLHTSRTFKVSSWETHDGLRVLGWCVAEKSTG